MNFFRMLSDLSREELLPRESFEAFEELLRPLAVSSPEEDAAFLGDLSKFLEGFEAEGLSDKAQSRLKVLRKDLDRERSREEDARKNLFSLDEAAESSRKQKKRILAAFIKARERLPALKDYVRLLRGLSSEALLRELAQGDGQSLFDADRESLRLALQDLKRAAGIAAGRKNYAELFDWIRAQKKVIDSLLKQEKEDPSGSLDRARKCLESREEERRKTEDRIAAILYGGRPALKESGAAASDFRGSAQTGGGQMPQFPQKSCFFRPFEELTKAQKEEIRQYIRENALRFKTKISGNTKSSRKRTLDLPATIRRALETGGIPLSLCYKKPLRGKASVILFLDVSGSCAGASEMMLTFMHELTGIFPGGCKSYAFVNTLYDISDLLAGEQDFKRALEDVLDAIPRVGVYSDYGRTFEEYVRGGAFGERESRMQEITKDTLLFFIGDARNNRLPSGEEYLREICRRAKRAYWLNTESRENWNTGDSLMGLYSRYMDAAAETVNASSLIRFITGCR